MIRWPTVLSVKLGRDEAGVGGLKEDDQASSLASAYTKDNLFSILIDTYKHSSRDLLNAGMYTQVPFSAPRSNQCCTSEEMNDRGKKENRA